ncbi:hypothetical protein ACFW0U_07335 [Streptomyces albidoflavus]|uniref:hypothetical protein n=1 Tax=Streptomyces albidoflavus TaxID=1886 RepID=UPI00101F8425|nr:hypothetical protein [Streptomyces albidoflavus]RZF05987.1 hypothetical protein C0R05_24450 [Streptomyces albidoflavus]
MTISLCKHRFPLTVGKGAVLHPSDCEGCGITFADCQAELDRQAEQVRLATAHDGRCEFCAKAARVFQFQRDDMPWDETDPPVQWLCLHCWSNAQTAVEETGFADLEDAFLNATDNQLVRFVFGGAR